MLPPIQKKTVEHGNSKQQQSIPTTVTRVPKRLAKAADELTCVEEDADEAINNDQIALNLILTNLEETGVHVHVHIDILTCIHISTCMHKIWDTKIPACTAQPHMIQSMPPTQSIQVQSQCSDMISNAAKAAKEYRVQFQDQINKLSSKVRGEWNSHKPCTYRPHTLHSKNTGSRNTSIHVLGTLVRRCRW